MTGWVQVYHIGPAVTLLGGAGVVLLADMILPRGRAPFALLTLLVLALAAGWAIWHANTGTTGPSLMAQL